MKKRIRVSRKRTQQPERDLDIEILGPHTAATYIQIEQPPLPNAPTRLLPLYADSRDNSESRTALSRKDP